MSSYSAEYGDNYVTAKGIAIITPSSTSPSWDGSKSYVRFDRIVVPNTDCAYNAAWFLRDDKDIYSLLMMAIASGKQLQIAVSDVNGKVGGSVCELVFLETH